ncbi:MAG: DUF1003 domain-containing protein [Gemmatimonadaceae bacterium]|nr:DUF1003 domain-containing protein [Gemmatimonadaceae bacterium]
MSEKESEPATTWMPVTAEERLVVEAMKRGRPISRNVIRDSANADTFGARLADRVARFGGSWTFILIFLSFLAGWTLLNTAILGPRREAFDPYPYIFLNLFLSMLAALQAPVIMMSQNRQGEKDRLHAANDYEVNLKAELEIRGLHDKLDLLRTMDWQDLVAQQRRQIELLTELVERQDGRRGA